MKILLDENLPIPLRKRIPGHLVRTVDFMGWKSVKNGQLLTFAAADGFEVLVTLDAAMAGQQNLATLPISILVLHARSNKMAAIEPLVPNLLLAPGTLPRRAVVHVR